MKLISFFLFLHKWIFFKEKKMQEGKQLYFYWCSSQHHTLKPLWSHKHHYQYKSTKLNASIIPCEKRCVKCIWVAPMVLLCVVTHGRRLVEAWLSSLTLLEGPTSSLGALALNGQVVPIYSHIRDLYGLHQVHESHSILLGVWSTTLYIVLCLRENKTILILDVRVQNISYVFLFKCIVGTSNFHNFKVFFLFN